MAMERISQDRLMIGIHSKTYPMQCNWLSRLLEKSGSFTSMMEHRHSKVLRMMEKSVRHTWETRRKKPFAKR